LGSPGESSCPIEDGKELKTLAGEAVLYLGACLLDLIGGTCMNVPRNVPSVSSASALRDDIVPAMIFAGGMRSLGPRTLEDAFVVMSDREGPSDCIATLLYMLEIALLSANVRNEKSKSNL